MMVRHTGENLKIKYLKEPYPKNLLLTVQADAVHQLDLPVDAIDADVLAGLDYALSMLTEQERTIVRMRYEERRTYEEIGKLLGVTRECIRNHEHRGLRRLREPKCLGRIKYGKQGYEALIEKRKAEESERMADKLNMTLEALDLTVRSFNCLKVRGCNTVRDVVSLTEEEILNTKNLGRKSLAEIAGVLHMIGIENTPWDKFRKE